MTTKEQIKAIIKQYADKGKTQYRECCDDNESASLINYWDGYRDCAYNLLRELEDMQEEPKFKVGDVIRRRDKIGMLPLEKTIIKIDNEKYWLDNGFTLPIKEINQWELVDESERRYPSFEESQGECHPFQDIALNG